MPGLVPQRWTPLDQKHDPQMGHRSGPAATGEAVNFIANCGWVLRNSRLPPLVLPCELFACADHPFQLLGPRIGAIDFRHAAQA